MSIQHQTFWSSSGINTVAMFFFFLFRRSDRSVINVVRMTSFSDIFGRQNVLREALSRWLFWSYRKVVSINRDTHLNRLRKSYLGLKRKINPSVKIYLWDISITPHKASIFLNKKKTYFMLWNPYQSLCVPNLRLITRYLSYLWWNKLFKMHDT